MQVWRLVKTKYAPGVFDGEGARLYGARWNSPGTRVAYASSNSALAVLEVRVHLGSVVPMDRYALLTVEIPERLIEVLPHDQWPRGWDAVPFGSASQRVGDRWLAGQRSVALRVPSVHSGSDFNLLLNPAHTMSSRARVVARRRYEFDSRLF